MGRSSICILHAPTLRRFAGERLERVAAKDPSLLGIASDTYQKARDDRPDHPSSHRLLAFAEVKQKRYEAAFVALERGLEARSGSGRFPGVERILREDLGLVAAAWSAAEPARAPAIRARLEAAHGVLEDGPSLRFVLTWETDANDVDFHIHDAIGGHAFYGKPHLPSGGDLYADVTQGYGPECFTIRGDALKAAPYRLEAHYYSRGPMGYGMGKVPDHPPRRQGHAHHRGPPVRGHERPGLRGSGDGHPLSARQRAATSASPR